MRYEMMFPDQLKQALADNTPVALPVGVLEYHAEHCPLGVDGLLVVRALEALEKEIDLVVLPPFYYGCASNVVVPAEKSGTLDIGSDTMHAFARELFRSLLAVGFRNVHVIMHHQTENFSAGMPTDLAFRFAARQAIFEFLEKERGQGWWGEEGMKDYYRRHASGSDPFNWIKVHPLMDAETQRLFPIDHAGRQETSLMMAFCPEGVRGEAIGGRHWFAAGAREASLEYGEKARRMIMERLKGILQ